MDYLEDSKMEYKFIIDGKPVTLNTFYKKLMELSFSFNGEREEMILELLSSGKFKKRGFENCDLSIEVVKQ